jgi:phage FluMu protein gp41
MFLSLQAGSRQGDPRSIEVGVRVLMHKAELNGYKAAEKIEMTGKQGGPLAIETFRKLCEEAEAEDAEHEDKRPGDGTSTK